VCLVSACTKDPRHPDIESPSTSHRNPLRRPQIEGRPADLLRDCRTVDRVPDYPEDLDHPMTRGDASLLGIGWRELAGPLWRSPYRGSHVWSATDPRHPLQRALDAAGLLPDGGALGGWAAAQVAGVSELDGVLAGRWQPVPLCLPPRVVRRRGPTVVPWRCDLRPDDIVEICGVPVTRAVRTAFDLARHGPLEASVIALDLLSRGRPAFLAEVADYLGERPGWRGVPLARRALGLASPRTRSPRESGFRLFWTLECGLAAPEVNASVLTTDGWMLGMGDLLDPTAGLLGEYDGAGHRDELQHALDNAREERIEDCGLVVVRLGHLDLVRHRARSRQRLLTGHARALRTPAGDWTWQPGPLPPPLPLW